jgi:hypothetical protein
MRNMSANQAFRKVLQSPATLLIVMSCFALAAISAEGTYSPKNAEEVEIISLVLASEVKANNWTKDKLFCFAIEGKDPDKNLVRTLRQAGLNVRSLADWRKNFTCGFLVYLRFISFDPSQTARIHAETADVREINNGDAHIAVRLRDGVYTARKAGGKWTISDYLPSK